MKSICAECGRSKFDRHGRCEYCGIIDYAVADLMAEFEREARKRIRK